MRAHAWCIAIACGLLGCESTLDVGRAQRWLDRPEEPSLPALQEGADAPLVAPEGLHSESGQLRMVPLRWDPVLTGNVGGYAVERAEQREGPYRPVSAVPGRAHTVWVDRGPSEWPGANGEAERDALADGETLFYRVRAFDAEGELAEAVSEPVAATTAPTPDPPPGLRAYSQQPREVPLSWEPAPNSQVAGYVVERSPTSQGPFEDLVEIPGRFDTAHVDRGLGDLRVFYYRVSSLNTAGGRGEPSKPVRAVTKPEPLPPIGLSVKSQHLGVNQLEWQPNVETDLNGYRLIRVRKHGDLAEPVASLAIGYTTAIDRAVGADEEVGYTVVALDSDGLESAQAEVIEVRSVGYELSAQALPDGVHLQWKARRDEGFHSARIFLDGALGDTELASVTEDRWVHGDAQPGKTYRYYVVLERADASPAPPSSPVAISVPSDDD